MKDWWRVAEEGIQKEGDIYKELHKAEELGVEVVSSSGASIKSS